MKIQKILCPTDFSAASDHALGEAVDLAKALGAKIKVIHVFQRPIGVALEGAPVTIEAAEQFLQQAHAELKKVLEDLRKDWQDKGVELEVELIEGAPYSAIVEEAAQCDLVVMATHGRTGFQRFMLGSVAERVVRTSNCPVMTIPIEKIAAKS